MEVTGMNDQCGLYLVPRNLNTLHNTCGARGVQWSLNSQGFVSVFSQDLVIGLQSEPLSKDTNKMLVCFQTQMHERLCEKSRSDLLVKEIFVHHSWNVEQGISHPKECVFTEGRQELLFYSDSHTPSLHVRKTLTISREDHPFQIWFDSFNFKVVCHVTHVYHKASLLSWLPIINMCTPHAAETCNDC